MILPTIELSKRFETNALNDEIARKIDVSAFIEGGLFLVRPSIPSRDLDRNIRENRYNYSISIGPS